MNIQLLQRVNTIKGFAFVRKKNSFVIFYRRKMFGLLEAKHMGQIMWCQQFKAQKRNFHFRIEDFTAQDTNTSYIYTRPFILPMSLDHLAHG